MFLYLAIPFWNIKLNNRTTKCRSRKSINELLLTTNQTDVLWRINLRRQGTTLNLRICAISIKNVYQVYHQLPSRNKILRMHLSLLWFLDFATVYSYFNTQMCSYLMLEIKYFVSLKTEFFLFWTRIHFKGGVKFSKILRGDAHKGWGGGLT